METAALVYLKMCVEIVSERKIGAQLESFSESFVGGTEALFGADSVFVGEPASATEPSPSGCVARLELHALLVELYGGVKLQPAAGEFVGAQVKLIDRRAGRAVLLQRSLILRVQGRKDRFDHAANQRVVQFKKFSNGGFRGVRPENGATRNLDELGGNAELFTKREQSAGEDDVDFGFSCDFLEVGNVLGILRRDQGRAHHEIFHTR